MRIFFLFCHRSNDVFYKFTVLDFVIRGFPPANLTGGGNGIVFEYNMNPARRAKLKRQDYDKDLRNGHLS